MDETYVKPSNCMLKIVISHLEKGDFVNSDELVAEIETDKVHALKAYFQKDSRL